MAQDPPTLLQLLLRQRMAQDATRIQQRSAPAREEHRLGQGPPGMLNPIFRSTPFGGKPAINSLMQLFGLPDPEAVPLSDSASQAHFQREIENVLMLGLAGTLLPDELFRGAKAAASSRGSLAKEIEQVTVGRHMPHPTLAKKDYDLPARIAAHEQEIQEAMDNISRLKGYAARNPAWAAAPKDAFVDDFNRLDLWEAKLAELQGKVPNLPHEPITVYHGTSRRFDEFDVSKADPDALYGPGLYFTDSPEIAGGRPGTEHLGYASKSGGDAENLRILQNDVQVLEDRVKGPDGWEWEAELAATRKKLDDAVAKVAPNVRPARLNIKRPFDVDKRYSTDDVIDWFAQLDIPLPEGLSEGFNLSGSDIYHAMEMGMHDFATGRSSKVAVNEALKQLGFDGITHIGGGRTGNKPHRVWIAFHESQVMKPWNAPAKSQGSKSSIFKQLGNEAMESAKSVGTKGTDISALRYAAKTGQTTPETRWLLVAEPQHKDFQTGSRISDYRHLEPMPPHPKFGRVTEDLPDGRYVLNEPAAKAYDKMFRGLENAVNEGTPLVDALLDDPEFANEIIPRYVPNLIAWLKTTKLTASKEMKKAAEEELVGLLHGFSHPDSKLIWRPAPIGTVHKAESLGTKGSIFKR